VYRVYLDELGDVRLLPVPIAATVLTIVEETAALDLARTLISRVMQEADSDQDRANLIDIVTSIMVYTAVFTTIRYRGCGGNAPTQGFHPCTPYPDSTKSAVNSPTSAKRRSEP
jgi:hypothetical protein